MVERSKYLRNVEEEVNDLSQWSCLQKQGIVILGDMNMHRLRPGRSEGKMLRDLEEVYNLSSLITEPTRVHAFRRVADKLSRAVQ